MANSAFVNLVLVLLFILRPIHAVNVQARTPFEVHGNPFSDVEFNVKEDEYFKLHKDILAIATRVPSTELHKHNVAEDEYSERLKGILAYSTRVPSTELDKHKVLPWQTDPQNQPPRWILTDLTVGDSVTTIALRIDNLYFVGFTDRNGHWYTFDDYAELIPGSTPIGFTGSYKGLGYEGPAGRAKLRELPLNSAMVVTAVQKLLDYDGPLLAVKEELQQAMATLVLVICEAARFTEIRATVSNGWNSVSYTYISRDEILVRWAQLSYELLCGWDNKRKLVQDLENDLHFEGKEAAYLLLHVLILPMEKNRRKKKGFGLVKDNGTIVENPASAENAKSSSVWNDGVSMGEMSPVASSNGHTKDGRHYRGGDQVAESELGYDFGEESVRSPNSAGRSASGSPFKSSHFGMHDSSPSKKESYSDHGGSESIFGGNYADETSWNFDDQDTESVWGSNAMNTEADHHGSTHNSFFGSDDFGVNPVRVGSPSGPSSPAYTSGFSPKFSESRDDSSAYNFGSFDSFRSQDSGFFPQESRFSRFDSISSSKSENVTGFDSANSSRNFGRFDSFDEADPFGSSGPFKASGSRSPPKF